MPRHDRGRERAPRPDDHAASTRRKTATNHGPPDRPRGRTRVAALPTCLAEGTGAQRTRNDANFRPAGQPTQSGNNARNARVQDPRLSTRRQTGPFLTTAVHTREFTADIGVVIPADVQSVKAETQDKSSVPTAPDYLSVPLRKTRISGTIQSLAPAVTYYGDGLERLDQDHWSNTLTYEDRELLRETAEYDFYQTYDRVRYPFLARESEAVGSISADPERCPVCS